MNPISRAAAAVALAFAITTPAIALEIQAQAPAAKPPAKVPAKVPAKPAAAPVPPAPDKAAASPESPIGQVVYQVLLGELALQRGNTDLAVGAYADLAVKTRDPKVLERATEIASYARRFDVANELSRLWLEVDPESTTARQTLTAVLILQGNAEALGPQISHLLEKDKANLTDNLLRLNRMLARYQDKPAVYRMLTGVLKPYDGIAEAHYALATAAYHAGEQQAALAEIGKALALRPDWDAAALLQAQLLARQSPAAGLEALERYVAANPDARDVRLHLARGLVAEKRYDDAQKHFKRLLAENPESPELLYPVAVIALQQNDMATAEPLLKKVLAKGAPSEQGIAAYYLGQIAEDRKAFDEAAGYYRQVVSGDQYAPAQIRVAALLARKDGGLDPARNHLQESARRYPPAETQFLVAEAELLRDAGRVAEALALLDSALAKKPDQPEVLYDAAMLAEKLDRMDVVETNLRRVIELRPDNAHAYNALGYSLADRNLRLEEARTLIERAHALAPNDPFIMDSLGWVLYRQGDLGGALQYLQRAYTIKADAEIAAHLGEVLWRLDRRDEALRTWNEALRRHPGNAILEEIRRKFAP